jgi:voltage-gated potassium channel
MWRQEDDGQIVHFLEPLMLVLALLALPVVVVEESHAPAPLRSAAAVANWVIWVGFAVEVLVLVALAPRKREMLRAHRLELAIVLLTPPFLPRVGFLRAARVVRVLRLLRLGVFGMRAVRAERVLATREGFRYIALLTAVLVVVAGASVSLVDSRDVPNLWTGIWWAVVTITTVGYGDVQIKTVAGQIVAMALMIVGIGFISVLTATIASSFISRGDEHQELVETLRSIERRLAALEDRP